jgi:hypothetical protein
MMVFLSLNGWNKRETSAIREEIGCIALGCPLLKSVAEWDEKNVTGKPQDTSGGQCKRGKCTGTR